MRARNYAVIMAFALLVVLGTAAIGYNVLAIILAIP